MSNSFSAPLRVGAVALGLVALVAVGLVVAYGPGEGRWIQGALGASPTRSASPEPSPSVTPTAADTEEPSPAGSPSPSTAAQIKAKNIADAKASLVEYYAIQAKVANNGYQKWERDLGPFWGTQRAWQAMTSVYEQSRQDGIYTEGAAAVISMQARGYTPAKAGFEEVIVDACVDFSTVKTFDGEGNLIPRDASVPSRYVLTYKMRNQGGKGREWALISEARNQERAC
ncbi:hypothetical protein [Myceligenerans salitolerans]|uniref:Lipoprotein n=1 Tax=Myceligenerans salitolerans TaxID=1230528 RepID=A0ABS3I6M3_9MICO|nr:hypothetical protein [Myceligenerans salitolerans]MBO0608281.1 hypothetical protein [Myceligenerans salitolerans]